MKNSIAESPVEKTRADYSLRSSGKTYIDRDGETQQIVDRVKTSSASVIGIAGVRGAGKSSLAKKVLDECNTFGFFTLLIPSPTGYEPREFLLAIFQRIAEHASDKLQTITEGTESLRELGNRRTRQIRRQLYVVLGGLLLFFLAGPATYIIPTELEIQKERAQLVTDLKTKSQAARAEGERRTSLAKRPSTVPTEESTDHDAGATDSSNTSRRPRNPYYLVMSTNLNEFASDIQKLSDEDLRMTTYEIDDELQLLGRRTTKMELMYFTGLGLIGVVIYLTIIGGSMYAYRLLRKYRTFTKHKVEVGLYSRCEEFIELIKYQSTLASSSQLSMKWKFFSGQMTSSKQLADRPLSLPGLTATCSEFLQEVAEVFSGKVVICIDELDKITEVTQLFELLKGIKGILGQENSHFILTISEDAMRFFNERLSRDRSLIESSFEEISYLDRLPLDLTTKVIQQSLHLTETSNDAFIRNCSVLWLFAAGIPREIKRNLFTCHSNETSIVEASSLNLWRLLYRSMLTSMLATSAPQEASDLDEQYRFLICVEALISCVTSLPDAPVFREFMDEVVGIIGSHFGPVFQPLLAITNAQKVSFGKGRSEANSVLTSNYFAQLVEIIIGAIILGVANCDLAKEEANSRNLSVLVYVYKYVPINPQYAFYGLKKFLDSRLQTLGINLDHLVPNPRRSVQRRSDISA